MKCPVCKKNNTKSKVFPRGGTSTLLGHTPYYDEDGVYHNHDPNRNTNGYTCSEGHTWTVISKLPCPAEGCDYGGVINTDIIKEA